MKEYRANSDTLTTIMNKIIICDVLLDSHLKEGNSMNSIILSNLLQTCSSE